MQNITLHPATKEDTEFARNVHHTAYHDVIVEQFGGWENEMQSGFFDRSWTPEKYEIILENDIPVGYCHFDRLKDSIIGNELVILPEFQGKGIGTKILQQFMKEAIEKNIPFKLQVLKKNKAQSLYRRLGFVDTGENDTHFKMEFVPK